MAISPTEKRRRQAEITRAAAPENRTKGPAKDTAVTAPKRATPGEIAGPGRWGRVAGVEFTGNGVEFIENESTGNSYGVPAGLSITLFAHAGWRPIFRI